MMTATMVVMGQATYTRHPNQHTHHHQAGQFSSVAILSHYLATINEGTARTEGYK